jgi:Na+(H+)/acetate symporter ActP
MDQSVVADGLTVAVLLHNAEEAVVLPHWSRSVRSPLPAMHDRAFRISVGLFSLIVVALGLSASRPADGDWPCYAMCALALAMAVNAVFPHLVLSLYTRTYMPGLGTGLALNVPLGMLYIAVALQSGIVQWSTFRWAVPVGAFSILAIAVTLLWVGRNVDKTLLAKERAGQKPGLTDGC